MKPNIKTLLTPILVLILLLSIAINIYQYTVSNSNKVSVDSLTAEINSLSSTLSGRESILLASSNTFSDLEDQATTLQSEIDTLNEKVLALETEKENLLDGEISPEEAKALGISPYAGKTSKHGWVYPMDYIEYGDRDVDMRGDVESLFDMGAISEEDYQACIEILEKTSPPGSTGGNSTGDSNTTCTGTSGSSNPLGTPGYDPATYIPDTPELIPDGIRSY